jgi:hypothetical protein
MYLLNNHVKKIPFESVRRGFRKIIPKRGNHKGLPLQTMMGEKNQSTSQISSEKKRKKSS